MTNSFHSLDVGREPAHQRTDTADRATHRWRRPTVNISSPERIGRVALGLLAVIAGVAFLTSATTALSLVLTTLLVLAGLDLAVTGALGHCPLYKKLGHVPASLRR